MTSSEVRQKYLDFFKFRGHAVVPSASLVPENDPTTLFTGSGMQPILPYLLGAPHPAGMRIANAQKCFRAEDIDEIGDNRHTTFFEMLGNWSFGDYWKEEQLAWFFEFLTNEIRIPAEKLWVTCFEGDAKFNLPKDEESAEIWRKIGIPESHIYFYPAKKNWWSRAGIPENMPVGEPGGPDSEVFYEFTHVEHDPKFGAECHPNCDCGRLLEIGNSVCMEYKKTASGGFEKLKQRNVDFGGGLERIAAVSENKEDIFSIDDFSSAIGLLKEKSAKKYSDSYHTKSFRIVADHIRAAMFMIADGVEPSNTERGYFVRRLIRRAILHLDRLGIKENSVVDVAQSFHTIYRMKYSELDSRWNIIVGTLKDEEKKFRSGLHSGFKELTARIRELVGRIQPKLYYQTVPTFIEITGKDLFDFYASHGLPAELALEEIERIRMGYSEKIGPFSDSKKKKMLDEFATEMQKHQEISRRGADKKFKGGLADTSEKSIHYHTATHLLNEALRRVLGNHVEQRGSNITPERLRFDFSHPQKMTDEERKKVEDIVNQKIAEKLPVQKIILPKEKAIQSGARHMFNEKYGNEVSVYFVGNSLETAFSKEFCGGPHVSNTAELNGTFKIQKEEAVSQGVRRIKAALI